MLAFLLVSGSLWIILGEFRQSVFVCVCVCFQINLDDFASRSCDYKLCTVL